MDFGQKGGNEWQVFGESEVNEVKILEGVIKKD